METEREMYTQIGGACYCGHYTGAAGGKAEGQAQTHRYGGRVPRVSTMKTLMIIVIYTQLLMINSVIGMPARDVSMLEGDAVKFLAEFGYISQRQVEQGAQSLMAVDISKAIKKLQRMGGITPTGVLDIRTQELMHKPRCGNKDTVEDEGSRKKRYVLAPSKWNHKDLTYRIENYTPDLPWQEVRRVLADAFKVWSDVTDLTFTEVMHTSADIMIKFASKYHKDGYPFDGKGLILAHAFFPGKDKGGDTHFDEDEKWTINSNEEGVDLFMVAAHEFGHALGLSHSNEPKALMYPWYQGYIPNFQLPYDDTVGIQVIYGGKGPYATLPPRERTTPRPDTGGGPNTLAPPRKAPIDPCKGSFNAIAVIRSEVFIFIEKYFWRSPDPKTILSSEPSVIHDFWYDLPEDVETIDAAFEHPTNRRIYFFYGNRYWIYDGNNMAGGHPKNGKPITDFGIPKDIKKIDAVFVWSFNKRIYLVSNDMYWKLKESDTYIEPDYPRDMSIWKNVPIPIDTAFNLYDSTYFFKGENMYKFYDMKMRVALNWPQPVKNFLGCRDSASLRKLGDSPQIAQHLGSSNSASNQGNLTISFLLVILHFIYKGFVSL